MIRGKGVSKSAEHGLEVAFDTGGWVCFMYLCTGVYVLLIINESMCTYVWLTSSRRPSDPHALPTGQTGDLFVMPHSAEPMMHAAAADSGDAVALYWVSDEPLLKVRRRDGWWVS